MRNVELLRQMLGQTVEVKQQFQGSKQSSLYLNHNFHFDVISANLVLEDANDIHNQHYIPLSEIQDVQEKHNQVSLVCNSNILSFSIIKICEHCGNVVPSLNDLGIINVCDDCLKRFDDYKKEIK